MYQQKGMLGTLFSPPLRDIQREEQYEDERLRSLAGDGIKGADYASLAGAQLAGKGLGSAVAASAGFDPRSPNEKHVHAVQAAKQQVAASGIDPSDTDAFYKAAIDILRKNGLVAEAFELAQEWNRVKAAASKDKLGHDKLALEKDELQRKRDRDLQIDARAAERNAILLKKLGAAASPVGKMIADMERTADPVMRAHLAKAISNATAGKWEAVDLGDRVQLRDKATGEIIDTEQKGLNPDKENKKAKAEEHEKWAYLEVKADMQRQIDKTAELHNHVGVDKIAGLVGQYVGDKDSLAGFAAGFVQGSASRGAAELWGSISGGTLLQGLSKLKEASKTGASGLGALSEQEGKKVQEDAAALGRSQEGGDLKLRLRQYIQSIAERGARLDAKARESEVTPIQPLTVPPLNMRGSRPTSTPPVRPKQAPIAPAAGGLAPEKQKRLAELRARRDAQGK